MTDVHAWPGRLVGVPIHGVGVATSWRRGVLQPPGSAENPVSKA